MRATVRHFHSPDADLTTYRPPDDTHFGLLVQIIAGPVDGPGDESFDLVYCSPSWLAAAIDRVGPVLGRHHLCANTYDWSTAERLLTARVEAESANSWHELALRLGRIGRWEFEDYRP